MCERVVYCSARGSEGPLCITATIFKNAEINRADIGDHMRSYAEREGLMKTPRRSLIGSMHGKRILLATPLLQWYLNHGL